MSSSEIAPKVMDDDDDTVNDRMTSTSIVSASHKEGGSRRSSFSSIIDVPDIINKRSSLYTNKFHSEHSKSDTHSGSLISNTNSKSVCPQSRHCRRLTSATTTPPPPTTTALFRKPLTESEYKARYWGQMLDTLRRTIDEIYSACETDENEVECKVSSFTDICLYTMIYLV
ncbi:unnamed protein product [Trichobilharzia regenti]|nr:unnamed protein product [Trichobilharzia regenti]